MTMTRDPISELKRLHAAMTNCDSVLDFDELAGFCVPQSMLDQFESLLALAERALEPQGQALPVATYGGMMGQNGYIIFSPPWTPDQPIPLKQGDKLYAEAPADSPEWQDMSTAPWSDDLIWLRRGNEVDGPRPIVHDDYDRYSHWATCEAPSIYASQQRASQLALPEGSAAVEAIQFALKAEDGIAWLRLWNEGEFDICRREWPEAPADVYIGADPLLPKTDSPSEVKQQDADKTGAIRYLGWVLEDGTANERIVAMTALKILAGESPAVAQPVPEVESLKQQLANAKQDSDMWFDRLQDALKRLEQYEAAQPVSQQFPTKLHLSGAISVLFNQEQKKFHDEQASIDGMLDSWTSWEQHYNNALADFFWPMVGAVAQPEKQ